MTDTDKANAEKSADHKITIPDSTYTPDTDATHVGSWNIDDAYTAAGTSMAPEVQTVYYLKEVPTCYLRNYHQIIYHKTTKELHGRYLFTAIDDTNYNENGFTLKSADGKTATVVKTFTITSATGNAVVLKPTTIFKSKGLTGDGYLGYWDVTGSDYFTTGSFTILPYWETPDEIKVDGINTRTIMITEMTKSGITKSDQ